MMGKRQVWVIGETSKHAVEPPLELKAVRMVEGFYGQENPHGDGLVSNCQKLHLSPISETQLSRKSKPLVF